jgi:CysZ protein
MIVESATAALRQTFSRPLRAILWKSLGLTLGLLVLVWFGLTRLIQAFQASHHISAQYPILDSLAYYLAGFGLVVVLAYLMPAVSILVAGFFLDDAAAIVERTDFPDDPPGRAMPFGTAMLYAVRFAGVTLLVNLAALVAGVLGPDARRRLPACRSHGRADPEPADAAVRDRPDGPPAQATERASAHCRAAPGVS